MIVPRWCLYSLCLLAVAPAIAHAQDLIIVRSERANVRSQPNTRAAIIATVPSGEILPTLGRSGTWTQVQLSDGRSGWMHSSTFLHYEPPVAVEEDAPPEDKSPSPGWAEPSPDESRELGKRRVGVSIFGTYRTLPDLDDARWGSGGRLLISLGNSGARGPESFLAINFIYTIPENETFGGSKRTIGAWEINTGPGIAAELSPSSTAYAMLTAGFLRQSLELEFEPGITIETSSTKYPVRVAGGVIVEPLQHFQPYLEAGFSWTDTEVKWSSWDLILGVSF